MQMNGSSRKFLICFLQILCVLFYPFLLHAQIDSIQQLNQIEITAQRIDLTDTGKHTDRIDSQTVSARHHDHLASMLAAHTPLFVRSYGSGTLATLGIRGGGAAHTQILWNGIPLRNPMIGLLDLALLPAAFIDEAAVHYGGHGAAFGSGAVGGLISIANNEVASTNGVHIDLGIGSWENRSANLQLDYGIKKIRFSSRIFTQSAVNNYKYKLGKDLPERRQVHHELNNNGLLQEIAVYINEQNSLTGRLWYQHTNRQIPPTSTQTTSKSAQQDESLRTSVQWSHQSAKSQWQIKSAWLDEIIDFQDTLILLYTHNRFRTWLAEGEASFRFSQNFILTGGLFTEVAKGESVNYNEEINRNQTAIFSSLRLLSRNWVWRFELREELTEGLWSPFLFDLATEWSFIKQLTLKTSLSRNYRVPTLNDLNWRPGGNPDLTPEDGWTFEAGLHHFMDVNKFTLSSSFTAYTRKIDDWIMWMPPVKDVRNYWSPINIAEVQSKGIETRSRFNWSDQKWKLDLRLGFDFTWSTFSTPLTEFGIEAGEQLFYVPVETGMTGMNIQYGKWSVFYDHHWFGPSTGINDLIREANIGSGGIALHFLKNQLKGSFYFQVDNVWNVPYRIIERRPMPGRSFNGGVKFSFS